MTAKVYRHTQSQTHTCNRKSVKSNQVPFLGTASKVISTLLLHAKCCLPSCVYSFRINNLVTGHLSPPCFLTFQIDDLIPLNRHLLTLISPWLRSPLFPCRIIKIIPTYNCVLVYLLLRGDEVCIYINDCLWRGVFHYHVIWTRHHNIILLHSCPFVIVIFIQQAENGKIIQ